MKTKHIIIGLVILVVVLFLMQKKEHAGSTTQSMSNEAIQNIATVYADSSKTVSFNNLQVTGEIKLPKWKGMITMWSGNLTDIPRGWVLCDGNNNTPDLRGKFVLGSGQGKDSTGTDLTNRNMNDKGGKEKVKLTVEEMPSHKHGIRTGQGSGSTPRDRVEQYTVHSDSGVHPEVIQNAGGDQPHENMPPFWVLAYIMKT